MCWDSLEDEMAEVRDQVKQARLEAEEAAKRTVDTLREKIAAGKKEARETAKQKIEHLKTRTSFCQDKMIEVLRAELSAANIAGNLEQKQQRNCPGHTQSYADVARERTNVVQRVNMMEQRRTPRLEELYRQIQQQYSAEDLTDVYFYVSSVGNLGTIRRTLVQDVFKGREDVVLNYNPHPSVRAGIGQIICPKGNVGRLVEELEKRKIRRLPLNYNPLHLSPMSRHLGERKKREIRAHQGEVLRNGNAAQKAHEMRW